MSQAPSLKTTPFASFGSFSFSNVFSSDYIHKKFGNFNIKAPTVNKGNFGLKCGLILNDPPASAALLSLSDEAKIGFPIQSHGHNLYLETRLRRNGEVKIHLDEGSLKINDKINFFSNVKTNMSLDNCTYRFGVNYFGDKCESGSRIEGTKDCNFNFTQRNIIKQGYFLFAYVATLGLGDFRLTKYDALMKYTHNKFDIYLRHFTPKLEKGSSGIKAGKGAVDVIYNHSANDTFGAHYKHNFVNNKSRVVIGAVHKVNNDCTVKAKVDQKLKVTATSKTKINEKLTVLFGLQLNLQHGANAFDFSKKIPIPLGFQIDLNV